MRKFKIALRRLAWALLLIIPVTYFLLFPLAFFILLLVIGVLSLASVKANGIYKLFYILLLLLITTGVQYLFGWIYVIPLSAFALSIEIVTNNISFLRVDP